VQFFHSLVIPKQRLSVPPFHWWRTVFFLIPAIGVYTIALGIVSLVSTLFDRHGYTAHRCAQLWAWLILKTTGVHVTVKGSAPPPDTSCVFASNHQSLYDIPVIFSSLPQSLRIIAKASLGKFPFIGWHLRWAGHLLLNRDDRGPAVLKKMQAMISDRASLIIFPEGTRSVDGTVGAFKGGVFLMAIDSGLPVVPLSISGTRPVLLRGRLMTRPGDVTLTIHPPSPTAGMTRADARALSEKVRAVIEADVEK
jgi:1-acyl-sn-glycerol-3-phosphate acyltransferase